MTTITKDSIPEEVSQFITRLPLPPGTRAEIVGAWTWLYTPQEFRNPEHKPTRQALTAGGFHWNRKRECWQHPGGEPSRNSRSDPRQKYGREAIALDTDEAEARPRRPRK